MHQLTIDAATAPVTISAHSSFEEAHHALLTYVIGADYYLWAITSTDRHSRYRLLRLADRDEPRPRRRPRIVGAASIEELLDSEHCCLPRDLDAETTPGATPT